MVLVATLPRTFEALFARSKSCSGNNRKRPDLPRDPEKRREEKKERRGGERVEERRGGGG